MNVSQIKKIIREELSEFIKTNKINETRLSSNTIPLKELLDDFDPSDLTNLKVYNDYSQEWLYIKSYDRGSKIWCGDSPDPNDEAGWYCNIRELVVDLDDFETKDFLEDIGYL